MNMTILDPDVAAASAALVAAHKRVVKAKNRTINQLQAEKGELQRALQSKAGEVVRAKMQAVDALDEAIAAHEPRPLTPDDFGQMAAAWRAADNDMTPNDGDTLIIWKGRDWWEIGVAMPGRPLDKRLARVLHRPPTRPEGAEEIQRLIRDAEREGQGADNEALADYLAARLTDPTIKEESR